MRVRCPRARPPPRTGAARAWPPARPRPASDEEAVEHRPRPACGAPSRLANTSTAAVVARRRTAAAAWRSSSSDAGRSAPPPARRRRAGARCPASRAGASARAPRRSRPAGGSAARSRRGRRRRAPPRARPAGRRGRASATGSTSERPAMSGWSGANSAVAAARRCRCRARSLRRATSLRTCSIASPGQLAPERLGGDRLAARPESTITAPPVAAASARTTSSSPRSSSTSRSSRLWIAMPRWSTSYCSFTSRVNAFSVSAMNGSSYGTSNTGKLELRRPRPPAPAGSVSWSKPVPKPRPARWCPASSRTNSRCRSSVSSWMPVVSRSSPPDSHGVGSGSSEMCTQRTGASAPSAPGRELEPHLRDASPTVSRSALPPDRSSGGRSGPRPR